MKTILITGANGFVGKNLIAGLNHLKDIKILKYDIENNEDDLKEFLKQSDIIIHLLGVNRPKDEKEFFTGNYEFTKMMTDHLICIKKKTTIVMTSSIQVELDNPYGKSKKMGEDALIEYAKKTGAKVFIYRLQNLFGKWGRPNYNSVIATFCYNIARDLPIQISNRENEVEFLYIDDVVNEFVKIVNDEKEYNGFYYKIDKGFRKKLGEIADKIYEFKKIRENLMLPDFSDPFTRYLYSTYISYIPVDNLSYPLTTKEDNRGILAEVLKSPHIGQIFFSTIKPGITRGNHYHHTKIEKFCVLTGKALIRLRNIVTDEKIEYEVSGDKVQIVDIPPGFTHSITNIGEQEVITLFWSMEIFDQNKPDTFFLEV
ncbi:MAG: NAD-dependent epimerase/dehydratase [candidate division TA06 bacterium 32_111]|uniref:NAD-dependent epimerase/dehydratase n=2 Tax=Bacteria candidate phyla TaxID=1783234 RepID=A0A101I4X8_UNCT6|nr:MAG: NAD-dependent epimerase/dehydratase [candidate division TA06 bacterium 32_111]KUK88005.1 MAG: NAD-dependent epimerase/dehydratase [candidate division TA06 bacterium 34_109]HAF06933.1 capsular biosynthesis protein [candidate division WOR-3 bacterium]HCP16847.1 capsular biosynthesis protein [candidate division WOR-3 bacterium]